MYSLNRFERWILHRIIRKLVRNRLRSTIFELVYDEHRRAFYEDNRFDREDQLRKELETTFEYKAWKDMVDFIG